MRHARAGATGAPRARARIRWPRRGRGQRRRPCATVDAAASCGEGGGAVEPLGDGAAAEAALQRLAGRTVYVHVESIPGGFLRNVQVELLRGYVRGGRVALRCRDGWVRMEDLDRWEADAFGTVVFLGCGDDGRLRRCLEVRLTPFAEPQPAEQLPAAAPPAGNAVPTLLLALAHPDDETFLCGGAVAAFAGAGGRVHLVCATRGEHGRRLGNPPFTTREGLPVQREAELRQACRILGIGGLSLLGLRDKCLEYEDLDELAARVALYVRRLRPDALLTFHEARGGHPDHSAIGRAARLAWEHAGDAAWHPEQLTDGARAHRPPRLYYLCGADVAAEPEKHGLSPEQITRVDCAPVARQKMLAFRAHRTQTQMERDLWQSDEDQVVARFARGAEYYEQANPPFVAGERGLLGLHGPGA